MLLMPFSSRLCIILYYHVEIMRIADFLYGSYSISPDVFQEKMSELLSGLEFAWAYLDDLLISSTEKGFEKHLEKLEHVFNMVARIPV
jgi:hypothetical protein